MALGAILEFFALWRIGSKLGQMDRRQAEMNEAWLTNGRQVDEISETPIERVEPYFGDKPPVTTDASAPTPPKGATVVDPAIPGIVEAGHWIIDPDKFALPAPQTRAKKRTWLKRLARWFAN